MKTKKQLKKLYLLLLKNNGLTLDKMLNLTTSYILNGYCVSIEGSETQVKNITFKTFKKYIKKYLKMIKNKVGENIGLWLDNNILYFDRSIIIKNEDEAIKAGRKNHQLAIYNIASDKVLVL